MPGQNALRIRGAGGEGVYQGAYGLQRGEARDRWHVYVRCDLRLAIGEDARGSRDHPPVQDLAVLIEKLRVIETVGIFRD